MPITPMNNRWLFVICLVLLCVSAAAQPAEIGSLRAKISKQQKQPGFEQDTAYINSISRLAYLYYALDADSLFFYAHKSFTLAQKINYQKGIAESLRQIGNGYMLTGDFNQSLLYYQQSLTAAEKINDNHLICLAVSNIGISYVNIGRYDDALVYSIKAYKLALQLGDSLRLAGELSNQAEIYASKKDYAKAFGFAHKSLELASILKNDYYVAFLSNTLGGILYNNIQYSEALKYYQQSLDYYTYTNDQLGITNTKLYIAKVYFKQGKYKQALKLARESLLLAQAKKGKKDIAEASQTLADIYVAAGDYKSAFQNLKMAKSVNDSLFNDETQKKLFELQAKYKYEQETVALKDGQAKKDLLNEHTLQNQKLQIVIAVLLIFTLGVIVIALYQSRADKQLRNKVLEGKNIEISRQKEEIEKQATELRVSNGQKDKLFSVIAHDLRSPFITLQGLLTLFKDGVLPVEKVTELMVQLNVNVDYTVNLVTNLLQWASSQMNGVTVNPVTFKLNSLLDEVLEGIKQPATDKKITVINNTVTKDLFVFADKDMVHLVARNLLSNAVKFCRPGDSITVIAEQKNDYIEVCVADTGCGITPEALQKINSGESITTFGTSKEKGTGLGLLLCKDFISRNNGTFSIESEPGKGSRFYFTLKNGNTITQQ